MRILKYIKKAYLLFKYKSEMHRIVDSYTIKRSVISSESDYKRIVELNKLIKGLKNKS